MQSQDKQNQKSIRVCAFAMKNLNLPASWSKMSFYAKLCYLVDTHQAKDFADARSMIGKKKKEPKKEIDMSKVRLPYSDN